MAGNPRPHIWVRLFHLAMSSIDFILRYNNTLAVNRFGNFLKEVKNKKYYPLFDSSVSKNRSPIIESFMQI